MPIDVIVVVIAFVAFSIGGFVLIKMAENELNKQNNNNSDNNENNPVLKSKKKTKKKQIDL